MTTTHKEALKALIHEMEYVLSCINADKVPFDGDDFHEALRLGKEALAQPEQRSVSEHLEPVAYLVYDHGAQSQYLAFDDELGDMDGCEVTPLYTHPPAPTQQGCSQRTAAVGEDSKAWVEPREWRGLTEEEIEACFHYVDEAGIGLFDFAEAVEAKLKEKNNGSR